MKRVATSVAWIVSLAGLALSASPAVAQSVREEIEAGNRLYEEGRYAEAHARYLEALRLDPESPLIRFNEGNALYQSQELERALEAYAEVIESEDPALGPQALYNLGNALAAGGQLEAALEAYKESLRRNPNDLDSKHNLELVLQQLQENEQDQQDQDQEDQQQDPQDQNQGSDGGDQQDRGDGQDEGQGGGGTGDEPPQDQPPGEGQGRPDEGQGEGSEGGEQELPPGQMSREEAERLLQAVQENPDELDRQAEQPRGRRPRKDW